jgi:GNAT superfamily N-acetyltransferase
MNPTFRFAKEEDVGKVLFFIKKIAEYEKMENEVVNSEDLLREYLFDKKRAEVFFILEDDKEVGFALYFYNYSTFVGRSGLYLEDLYILPEYRHKGYGKKAFLHLVEIAKENHCGRMEWVCLNWNRPSIDFYHSLGAISMDEWTTYRLTEDKILALAKQE